MIKLLTGDLIEKKWNPELVPREVAPFGLKINFAPAYWLSIVCKISCDK
jgi:hypothetical protein